MKATVFEEYLNKHLQVVEKNLSAYEEDMKPKRLHRMRVGIKKIRALLSFIQKTYQIDYDISRLKRVFKRAGELRDNRLHIQLLEEQSTSSEELLSNLENQKNGRKGAFKMHSSLYRDEVSQVREAISLPSEKLNTKRVKSYFEENLEEARQDIEDKDRDKAHRFRKRIKKVLYLYKALPKKLKKKIKLNADYLGKVQKKAGNWHDTHLALQFVSQQPQKPGNMDRLEAKEEKQFEALLDKVKVKRLSVGKH